MKLLIKKNIVQTGFVFAILFVSVISANAQYKKASFLRKKGRTYDLGLTTRLLGGGNGVATGFSFGYGKERSDKRLFHWWDLDLILETSLNIIQLQIFLLVVHK